MIQNGLVTKIDRTSGGQPSVKFMGDRGKPPVREIGPFASTAYSLEVKLGMREIAIEETGVHIFVNDDLEMVALRIYEGDRNGMFALSQDEQESDTAELNRVLKGLAGTFAAPKGQRDHFPLNSEQLLEVLNARRFSRQDV